MSLPITTGEYIIMIFVYLVLSGAFIIFNVRKWRQQKSCVWTAFETGFLFVQIFCIGTLYTNLIFCLARLVCLAFLLYTRYGFFTMYESSTAAKKAELARTGAYLVCTFELFFAIGTNILYSAISVCLYKLQTILYGYKASRSTFGWILVTNIVVHAVGYLFVILQYTIDPSDSDLKYVHLGYYWYALHFGLLGIAIVVTSQQMFNKTQQQFESSKSATGQIFNILENMNKINTACVALMITMIIRGTALALDALESKIINVQTDQVVIWNLIFKYTLWLGPEVVLLIAYGAAMYYGEDLFINLAVMQLRYKGDGKSGEEASKVYVQLQNQDPNSDEHGDPINTVSLESITGDMVVNVGSKPAEEQEPIASNQQGKGDDYVLMQQ